MRLRTVTVDRGGKPVRINESSFDPERDSLWQTGTPEKEPERDPDGISIVGQGRGWYRVIKDGEDLSGKNLRLSEAEALADEHR